MEIRGSLRSVIWVPSYYKSAAVGVPSYLIISENTSSFELPQNSGSRATISNKTQPNAHKSTSTPYVFDPNNNSGARYVRLPTSMLEIYFSKYCLPPLAT